MAKAERLLAREPEETVEHGNLAFTKALAGMMTGQTDGAADQLERA